MSDKALRSPNPQAQIELIEGHSDLVDTEATNLSLRLMRADAVAMALVARGEGAVALVGSTRGAAPGELLMNNTTVLGRSMNCSVVVRVVPRSTHPLPRQPQPNQPSGSQLWTLTSLGGLTIGHGYVGSGGLFTLRDREHNVDATFTFLERSWRRPTHSQIETSAVHPPSTRTVPNMPPRPSLSLPSGTDFRTSRRARFEDFNMRPGSLAALGFGIFFGYGVGFAMFDAVPFRIEAESGGIPLVAPNFYVGTNMLDIGWTSDRQTLERT